MGNTYITDKKFAQQDFAENGLPKGDYENCTFSGCNFAKSDLSELAFEDCTFEDCDLSNIKTKKTAFRNIKFKSSKLLGIHFDECHPFLLAFQFEQCQLNYSSFYQLKMKGTKFRGCLLHEVDFVETDLNQSDFSNCDLSGAIFGNTNLQKCDFRTSYNFSINPENNPIQHAKFSVNNISGLLHRIILKLNS